MNDHPMLFKAPMIRALLDGTKTQTRRILKPQPKFKSNLSQLFPSKGIAKFRHEHNQGNNLEEIKIPIAVGDRIWCRETWRTRKQVNMFKPSELAKGEPIQYMADPEPWDFMHSHGKTRVSIHMPRVFSRITLLVTDVRVQRLKDISETDADKEGLFRHQNSDGSVSVSADGTGQRYITPSMAFADLWSSTYGPYAWNENPWVVAYSFDVVKQNIDEVAA